jgi:thioredoxin 1
MGSGVRDVTDANFSTEVLGANNAVLVDFWAEWCGPCKALAPHVATLADEHVGKLDVVKLDIQTNMKTASTYRVTSIPTLIVFKGGKEVARQVGAQGGLVGLRRLVEKHVG